MKTQTGNSPLSSCVVYILHLIICHCSWFQIFVVCRSSPKFSKTPGAHSLQHLLMARDTLQILCPHVSTLRLELPPFLEILLHHQSLKPTTCCLFDWLVATNLQRRKAKRRYVVGFKLWWCEKAQGENTALIEALIHQDNQLQGEFGLAEVSRRYARTEHPKKLQMLVVVGENAVRDITTTTTPFPIEQVTMVLKVVLRDQQCSEYSISYCPQLKELLFMRHLGLEYLTIDSW